MVRPAGILAIKGSDLLECLLGTFAVRIDELAAEMVNLAVHGGCEQVIDYKVIAERGKKLLTTQNQYK